MTLGAFASTLEGTPFGEAVRDLDLVGRLQPGTTVDSRARGAAAARRPARGDRACGCDARRLRRGAPTRRRRGRRRAAGHPPAVRRGRPRRPRRERERREPAAAARGGAPPGAGRPRRARRGRRAPRVAAPRGEPGAGPRRRSRRPGGVGVPAAGDGRARAGRPARGSTPSRVDAGVVAFSVLLVFVTAALAGLWPALHRGAARRRPPSSATAAAARAARPGAGAARSWPRRWPSPSRSSPRPDCSRAACCACSSVDTGLAADRLVLVPLAVPEAKYASPERRQLFLDEVVARLEATPGIERATPVHTPPFAGTGGWDVPSFTAEGQDADGAGANPSLNLESVYPGYFETLQVAMRRGRSFTADDRAATPRVAVVSADLAARLFPGADPLGRRLKFGGPDSKEPWWTIVGVAETHALPRAGGAPADALRPGPAVRRRRRHPRGARPPAGWRARAARARAGARGRPGGGGSQRLDLRRARAGASRPAPLRRAPDRRVRRRGAAAVGGRPVRGDGRLGPPAQHRDRRARRPRSDAERRAPTRPLGRLAARRGRRGHRTRRSPPRAGVSSGACSTRSDRSTRRPSWAPRPSWREPRRWRAPCLHVGPRAPTPPRCCAPSDDGRRERSALASAARAAPADLLPEQPLFAVRIIGGPAGLHEEAPACLQRPLPGLAACATYWPTRSAMPSAMPCSAQPGLSRDPSTWNV